MAESKLDWSEEDTLTPEQMNRIESIVDNIKNGIADFYGVKTFNDAVVILNTLTVDSIESQSIVAGNIVASTATIDAVTGTTLNFNTINNKIGQNLVIGDVTITTNGEISGAVFGA